MNVQLMSDLHLEFQPDGGRALVNSFDPSGVDVLVVAGDLAPFSTLEAALRMLCERYSSAEVVFVAGNHEYYGSSSRQVDALRRDLRLPNLRWLECDVVEIRGRRFLGCTLWFRESPARRALADFRVIRQFEPWVYERNAESIRFLERELRQGDIVVTHHLPSQASVAKEYEGSPLNAYFVCDVERLIDERSPAIWVHGHTHSSCTYAIGSTIVMCNPRGYRNVDENPEFDPRFILEIG